MYVIRHLLFNDWPHFFVVRLTGEELVKLISNDFQNTDHDIKYELSYHGLQEYNVLNIMKEIVEARGDVDFTLDRLTYQAEAMEFNKENQKNKKKDK